MRKGYFDEKGNLRPEVVTTEAKEVVHALWKGQRDEVSQVSYGQLRKFYQKAKHIEMQLDSGRDWESMLAYVFTFDRDAHDALGRQTVPPGFIQFVERNLQWATKNERAFREGFLQHFQSVLAYLRAKKR